MRSQRDGIYSPAARQGSIVRGMTAPQRGPRVARLAAADPIKPYVYGGSQRAAQPQPPEGAPLDLPSPETLEYIRERARLLKLQTTYRPLTTAELLPGLWVEQIVESRSENYSNPGLLAFDRRLEEYASPDAPETHRLVLWVPKPGGLVRSHFVLGPGYARDDSFPCHEMWPIDPDYFAPDVRELLKQYAEHAVYNRERGEFEITA